MKFSENWLREWSNPEWDTHMLSESLSLAGLEVDGAPHVFDVRHAAFNIILNNPVFRNVGKKLIYHKIPANKFTYQVNCSATEKRLNPSLCD